MESTRDNGHINTETDHSADLDYLRAELTSLGVDLSSARNQRAIAARRSRARELVKNATGKRPGWFSALETLIISTGNTLVLVLMLILSYVLPPVAVLGLGYAEVQRVALGVGLFDPPRAYLMSVVAVASYLVLLVVQSSRTYNREQSPHTLWSLRLWFNRLIYVLGFGLNWRVRGKTTDQQLETAITRLGWLIIALGTVGTLQDELTAFSGTWYESISAIITESSLIVFLSLIGGCLLTAGLLAGLHFITEFTYSKFAALLPEGTDFFATQSDIFEAEDQAELLYLQSLRTRMLDMD